MGDRAQRVYTEKYSPESNYPLLIDAYRKAIDRFATENRSLALTSFKEPAPL